MDIKTVIDAKGLACPMPIVRTRKAMAGLESGEILEVLTTDKGSKADLTAWTASQNHEIVEASEENGIMSLIIKKG
ncbi:sulfurtransferase TusA family protein [Pseudogracilibacillus auburnensis]|uniref:sulfurtransferase TusA family protein n=1 Tax=Pseudogracilibacillus auburnensis TaxID=1494959 RepID=UPI001A97A75A|nr:sulfurtransferase TusA family protein [Pseudogracilibacillus auburnensis]MBO1003985.1 sulfurtransferase TusA family protein [Pseudogracilibacillus auburnensis]